MSYFTSPTHGLLPPVVDPMAYLNSHAGMGLTNSGSAALPVRGFGALSGDGEGPTMGWFARWLVLSGINFVLLWLFIREFGIAMAIAAVLGGVEATIGG